MGSPTGRSRPGAIATKPSVPGAAAPGAPSSGAAAAACDGPGNRSSVAAAAAPAAAGLPCGVGWTCWPPSEPSENVGDGGPA